MNKELIAKLRNHSRYEDVYQMTDEAADALERKDAVLKTAAAFLSWRSFGDYRDMGNGTPPSAAELYEAITKELEK
jgi:hypothetical protein